jgi:hypothetical protein
MSEFTGLEHLSREHYAGFGMVITMTCHLDGLLDQIIVAMTNSANEPAFYLLNPQRQATGVAAPSTARNRPAC